MRLVPILILLALASPASAAAPDSARVRVWQTGLVAPDRLQHASLSLTAGLMLGASSREPAAALGGAIALGLGKELWDRRHGRFDAADLLADLVGAAAAAWVTSALDR
jgi:hypothetical protein